MNENITPNCPDCGSTEIPCVCDFLGIHVQRELEKLREERDALAAELENKIVELASALDTIHANCVAGSVDPVPSVARKTVIRIGEICEEQDYAPRLADRDARIRAEQQEQIDELTAAVKARNEAVEDLASQSHGVAGLHLNGDIASWDSLLEGGQFEDWLKVFTATPSQIRSDRDARMKREGAVKAMRKVIETFHKTEWYSMSDDCIASNRCGELIEQIERGEVEL